MPSAKKIVPAPQLVSPYLHRSVRLDRITEKIMVILKSSFLVTRSSSPILKLSATVAGT